MPLLLIENLTVEVNKTPILQGFDLTIREGEIHAIMGKNGMGKSTLAKTLAGHPGYIPTKGKILYQNEDLLTLLPEERARKGIFSGFQYPLEIPGVTNEQFLYSAYKERKKALKEQPLSEVEFSAFLDEKMLRMEIPSSFKSRYVNEGFSGGEKKKNEILQMAILDPTLAILDETDSGLDIDAMKLVSKGINEIMGPSKAMLLITHYQRLLTYIQPHFVHVLHKGKIIKTGGSELAVELEEKGYDWI